MGQPHADARKSPCYECQLGRIRGAVWQNDGKTGPWYSVTITRRYYDAATKSWKSATTFGRDDLLVVAEVSRCCYLYIAKQPREQTAAMQDHK